MLQELPADALVLRGLEFELGETPPVHYSRPQFLIGNVGTFLYLSSGVLENVEC